MGKGDLMKGDVLDDEEEVVTCNLRVCGMHQFNTTNCNFDVGLGVVLKFLNF